MVGPGRTLTKPSQAAAVAQNGDTILVDAGQYVGDVASWNANNLTICGVGGRASLVANGANAQGKGIWVVGGPVTSTMTVVNVEFHGATVPDQNGAGIRLDGGNLVLRNTGFYDGENGILGGEQGTTVTIEYSEFARNGFGDGFTHNLYIGFVDRLTVRASYFHHAKIGHNLKSRGKENVIEDSYFLDGTTGTSSYLLDFPNGGVVTMRGNLLQKGPLADNSILISYRAEPGNGGINWAGNTVTMTHNTLVSTYAGGAYLYGPPGTLVTMTANLFAGSASLSTGGPTITQSNNRFTTADSVPNAPSANFWPIATQQVTVTPIPDPQYVSDAPRPMSLRTISGTTRLVGALQSAP